MADSEDLDIHRYYFNLAKAYKVRLRQSALVPLAYLFFGLFYADFSLFIPLFAIVLAGCEFYVYHGKYLIATRKALHKIKMEIDKGRPPDTVQI